MKMAHEKWCSDCTHVKIENPSKCVRCGFNWVSRLEKPRYCPNCKTPRWNTDRIASRYPEIRLLNPGENILIPWPAEFNHDGSRRHPAAFIVTKLNMKARRVEYSVHYDSTGARVFRLKEPMPFGGRV